MSVIDIRRHYMPNANFDFASVTACETKQQNAYILFNTGGGILSGNISISPPFMLLEPEGGSFNLGKDESQVVRLGFSTTAIESCSETLTITSNSGNANFSVSGTGAGATMTVTVRLQGGFRPDPEGYHVPMKFKLYSENVTLDYTNILEEEAFMTYTADNISTSEIISLKSISDSTATIEITGLPTGTYNVTLYTTHALINLKEGQEIASSGTSFSMGTLLEGNANEDVIVSGFDFDNLLTDYLQTNVGPKWNNGRCDFDRNGQVTSIDFSLLSDNYNKTSPQ